MFVDFLHSDWIDFKASLVWKEFDWTTRMYDTNFTASFRVFNESVPGPAFMVERCNTYNLTVYNELQYLPEEIYLIKIFYSSRSLQFK